MITKVINSITIPQENRLRGISAFMGVYFMYTTSWFIQDLISENNDYSQALMFGISLRYLGLYSHIWIELVEVKWHNMLTRFNKYKQ